MSFRLDRRRPHGGHSPADRTSPPAPSPASTLHFIGDLLGRVATALAVAFIVYALFIQHDQSTKARDTASRAEDAAHAAQRAAGAAQRSAGSAQLTSRDVAQLLLEAQRGRAVALKASCTTNNRQNTAIRATLHRFRITGVKGFGPIDCEALAARARVGP